eukprot:TRINITY_DN2398_c0_g3_i1.p1 TRINITY_DN2398_c0_g3~~TRINITY_DN2398_c0_g3_i1.p1  ORF type:complete len:492 (-),score=69.33 TRINITY_DN2398_c0_g3_i1:24-1499(-)
MGVRYQRGSFRPLNLVKLYGSVFPYAFVPALISAIIAAVIKHVALEQVGRVLDEWLLKPLSGGTGFAAYTAFVTFLVTFRTGKAYDRFWNGANDIKMMQAEFFVTASNLFAFVRPSPELEKKAKFQHTLVRLLSLLHAVALHQLGAGGDGVDIARQPLPRYELVDINGLDPDTLDVLVNEECRVELIIQWVQSLTVDGIKAGVCVIPPPILSRIFQNLSNALTSYYSAYRVTEVPYPFPYVQTTEVMLLLHMLATPFMMQAFVSNAMWSFVCTFIPIFALLSLNFIAAELENPFNETRNVLNMFALQRDFNKRLCLLIKGTTNKVPFLSESCIMDEEQMHSDYASLSLADAYEKRFKPKATCDGATTAEKLAPVLPQGPSPLVANAKDNATTNSSPALALAPVPTSPPPSAPSSGIPKESAGNGSPGNPGPPPDKAANATGGGTGSPEDPGSPGIPGDPSAEVEQSASMSQSPSGRRRSKSRGKSGQSRGA